MSAPALDGFTLASLGAALLAALGGSLHCLGMCGPLRLLASQGWGARVQYQSGRLIAYLALGLGAGGLGAALPLWLLLVLVGVALALSLVKVKVPIWERARGRLLGLASAHPFLLGSASGLLPCGLLHLWVGVAAASGSAWQGAALLFILWAGSLPALEFGSLLVGRVLAPLRRRFPALPVILVLLALAPILMRVAADRSSGAEPDAVPACHSGH